jgi:NAD-dependent deacetylase
MALDITDALRSLLVPSTRVIVFTGAGVSAESGVPTFRGSGGLWDNFKVEDYATPQAFQHNPLRVWEWYNWRREEILKAGPNPGHFAIHAFEEHFTEFTLITQNVDGLHEQAGNRNILKLHGDIWETRCSECGYSAVDTDARKGPLPPVCSCGGKMRPGVVWFGEFLPEAIYEKAANKSENCDLFFTVGTSAEVYPAAILPPQLGSMEPMLLKSISRGLQPRASRMRSSLENQGKYCLDLSGSLHRLGFARGECSRNPSGPFGGIDPFELYGIRTNKITLIP